MNQKPTVGRIVHFVEPVGDFQEHKAAIITRVHNDTCVNLTVFKCNGALEGKSSVCFDGNPTPALYTFHWPEREDAVATPAATADCGCT
jgi:hypothetical protein